MHLERFTIEKDEMNQLRDTNLQEFHNLKHQFDNQIEHIKNLEEQLLQSKKFSDQLQQRFYQLKNNKLSHSKSSQLPESFISSNTSPKNSNELKNSLQHMENHPERSGEMMNTNQAPDFDRSTVSRYSNTNHPSQQENFYDLEKSSQIPKEIQINLKKSNLMKLYIMKLFI